MRYPFHLAAALLALSVVSPASAAAGVVRLDHVIETADARALERAGAVDNIKHGYGGPCEGNCTGKSMTISQSAGAQRDTLNARLDELYGQLAAALGPRKAAGLKAERDAWEKSARARCNKDVPYYQGTGWRLAYARCKNREATAHIETLETRLGKLRQ